MALNSNLQSVSRKKISKMFLWGSFFCMLHTKFLSKCPYFQKSPLPWKVPGYSPDCVKSIQIRGFSAPQGYDQKRKLFRTNSFVHAHSSAKKFYFEQRTIKFSHIQTEYGDLQSRSPYSVRTRENTNQKKLRIWTLSTQCW